MSIAHRADANQEVLLESVSVSNINNRLTFVTESFAALEVAKSLITSGTGDYGRQ